MGWQFSGLFAAGSYDLFKRRDADVPQFTRKNGCRLKMSQIEAFCTVIQTGSISEAARLCHITQPAVSMQVRDLEQYCQQRLLKRSNKGVTLHQQVWSSMVL